MFNMCCVDTTCQTTSKTNLIDSFYVFSDSVPSIDLSRHLKFCFVGYGVGFSLLMHIYIANLQIHLVHSLMDFYTLGRLIVAVWSLMIAVANIFQV